MAEVLPFAPGHLDAVVALSLRAWAPVFESLEQALDPAVYREFYPDWRVEQAKAVANACTSKATPTWVAVDHGTLLGFVTIKLHPDSTLGEIYMIAVDPDHQGHGTGAQLTDFALTWMRQAGVTIAMVETGGDPGHAPARRLYERSGFGLFPVARYFQKL